MSKQSFTFLFDLNTNSIRRLKTSRTSHMDYFHIDIYDSSIVLYTIDLYDLLGASQSLGTLSCCFLEKSCGIFFSFVFWFGKID